MLSPPIPKSIRFAEAPAIGRSILSVHKNHKGAEAYREVAKSLHRSGRVVHEMICRLACGPATGVFESLGQVPVIESDQRPYASSAQSFKKRRVEGDPSRI